MFAKSRFVGIYTKLIRKTDIRPIFNIVLDQITLQLKTDAAAIFLLNPSMQSLEYCAGRGFRNNDVQRSSFRLGEGLPGLIALNRNPIHILNLAGEQETSGRSPILAAEGFVTYFGLPLIAKGQVKGVLEVFHRSPFEPDSEWLEFLETVAGQAAIATDDIQLFDKLQRSNDELVMAYDATIEGWVRGLDLRDKETEGHTERVTDLTVGLAKATGMSDSELVHVRRGALLHDIGKIGIPDAVLLKPASLNDEEWVIMRKHPVYAYEMLSPIAYLRPAIDIPWHHHEKWDGSGYPYGLKGETIPLGARLFAVVDVWDALISDRPYRAAWPAEKVREDIEAGVGSHFDPAVVEAFFKSQVQNL